MKRPLPIGISDFKRVIENNHYYVDKTLMIKDIIDADSSVLLLPRPRRFGKTLNMSMLKYFFEQTKESTSYLFEHLNIWNQGEQYQQLQGKSPVVFISLKDIKQSSWEGTYAQIVNLMADVYRNHYYLLTSTVLDGQQKEIFKQIINREADIADYENSLKNILMYIYRDKNQKVILLIDEYDIPIQCGYEHHFYTEIIGFMRNWLSGALKDNSSLQFACLTGILRVAKESIFSGLNNLEVSTLLDESYSTCFGFTNEEVKELVEYYEMDIQMHTIAEWYNGYVFGKTEIYNPWSILNYVRKKPQFPSAYWVNTSGNELIHQLLLSASPAVKEDLETLIDGEIIEKRIDENIVYGEIGRSDYAIWSFLLFSGYLKSTSRKPDTTGRLLYELKIPNKEVFFVYEDVFLNWWSHTLEEKTVNMMLRAFCTGDVETFELILQDLILKSTGIFDSSESFYHGFVLGLLVYLRGQYAVKSNRESGYGRYDVMLIPKNKEDNGIVVEFKAVRKETTKETLEQVMVEELTRAKKQIEIKKYDTELLDQGIKNVLKYAIVFSGKHSKVELF